MFRNLLLLSLMVFAVTALGLDSATDAPFIDGWEGQFKHGGTVTLSGSVFTEEKSVPVMIAIGDRPDFEQCTRQEPQTPGEWSERSATFQVDTVEFTEGEQVYVFLIRDDGAVSRGHAVKLGDQIPPLLGPGQPSKPTLAIE